MEATVKGNELTLKLTLIPEKDAPYSNNGRGKNKVLFSSGGFTTVDGYRVSLNVIPAK